MTTRLASRFSAALLLSLLAQAAPALAAGTARPAGWYQWRGPEENGVSRETGLPDTWDPETGEKPRHYYRAVCGICIFFPALIGNRVHSYSSSSPHVSVLCRKKDKCAHRIAFLGRVHNQCLVSNGLRYLSPIRQ